jgi:hypothetical protein
MIFISGIVVIPAEAGIQSFDKLRMHGEPVEPWIPHQVRNDEFDISVYFT